MNTQTAFWILVTITGLELIALYALATTIKTTLKSDFFKNKIKNVNDREKNSSTGNMLMILVLCLIPSFGWAAEASAEASESFINIGKPLLYSLVVIDVILLAILYYLKNLLGSILNYDKTDEEVKEVSSQLVHSLTDAVPVELEHTIEMDHDYDGIRELDNNLPPWWVYMFYMTIIFAGIYLVRYHVTKSGDLQIAEYEKNVAEENALVAEYLKSQAMDVDETNVVQLTDASAIAAGKKTFTQFCTPCHVEGGIGKIGPNLTDDYWIHGGDIKDIFSTIKNGAARGMKSWKDELNPIQMQEVASYIMSLTYVSPEEGGLKPEGDKYVGSDAAASGDTETADADAPASAPKGEPSAEGKKIYDQFCLACHKPNGGGLVGPNLTDEYW